jgi:hypothetical protein
MARFMRVAAVSSFALVLALGVAGCGSKYTDKVVGTWNWNVGAGSIVVTINKDGTGSLKGPMGEKSIKWRIQRGNNMVLSEGGKDSGFLIDSADENTIRGTDPQSPGVAIVWTRKK